MKTKPLPSTSRPVLTLDGRCKIFTEGKELDSSMLGTLYTVVTLARLNQPQDVFYQDGALLLRHDGMKTLESVPEFEQAVVDFSLFMLEEQKRGYGLYQAATQGAAGAQAPEGSPNPESDRAA